MRFPVTLLAATALVGAASAQTGTPAPGAPANRPATTAPGTPATTTAPAAPATTTAPGTGGTGSSNSAVNPANRTGPDAARAGSATSPTLEPGANSFTEGQARSRMEAAGFQDVTDLRKDDQGIWRGKAKRGAQAVNVGIDYKGNVATQ